VACSYNQSVLFYFSCSSKSSLKVVNWLHALKRLVGIWVQSSSSIRGLLLKIDQGHSYDIFAGMANKAFVALSIYPSKQIFCIGNFGFWMREYNDLSMWWIIAFFKCSEKKLRWLHVRDSMKGIQQIWALDGFACLKSYRVAQNCDRFHGPLTTYPSLCCLT